MSLSKGYPPSLKKINVAVIVSHSASHSSEDAFGRLFSARIGSSHDLIGGRATFSVSRRLAVFRANPGCEYQMERSCIAAGFTPIFVSSQGMANIPEVQDPEELTLLSLSGMVDDIVEELWFSVKRDASQPLAFKAGTIDLSQYKGNSVLEVPRSYGKLDFSRARLRSIPVSRVLLLDKGLVLLPCNAVPTTRRLAALKKAVNCQSPLFKESQIFLAACTGLPIVKPMLADAFPVLAIQRHRSSPFSLTEAQPEVLNWLATKETYLCVRSNFGGGKTALTVRCIDCC